MRGGDFSRTLSSILWCVLLTGNNFQQKCGVPPPPYFSVKTSLFNASHSFSKRLFSSKLQLNIIYIKGYTMLSHKSTNSEVLIPCLQKLFIQEYSIVCLYDDRNIGTSRTFVFEQNLTIIVQVTEIINPF